MLAPIYTIENQEEEQKEDHSKMQPKRMALQVALLVCTAINHTAFNNIYDQQKKTVKMMMMYFNFSAHSSLLYDIMVEFSEHFL